MVVKYDVELFGSEYSMSSMSFESINSAMEYVEQKVNEYHVSMVILAKRVPATVVNGKIERGSYQRIRKFNERDFKSLSRKEVK